MTTEKREQSTLLTESTLVVHGSPGVLMTQIAKRLADADSIPTNVVFDGHGRRLGAAQPVQRSTARKLGRLAAMWIVPEGLAPASVAYALEVLDAQHVKVLELKVTGGAGKVTVIDAEGRIVGVVDNESEANASQIDVRFYGPDRAKSNKAVPLASCIALPVHVEGKSFAVHDAAGRVVATVTHKQSHVHRIELEDHVADPLRTLLVAFACSLVAPEWLKPTSMDFG